MNKLLACALGLLALGLFTGASRADDDKKAPEGIPAPAAPAAPAAAPAAPVMIADGGCCNGGCGHKSIAAASCCDDCCKPSFCDRLKEKFRKKDCCDACAAPKCDTCAKPAPCNACAKPACDACDPCCKPKLWDRICANFKKKDCCEAPKPCCEAPKPACDSCCKPKHTLFSSHKSCDTCNTCNSCGAAPAGVITPAPAMAPEMKAEPIPAPMPK